MSEKQWLVGRARQYLMTGEKPAGWTAQHGLTLMLCAELARAGDVVSIGHDQLEAALCVKKRQVTNVITQLINWGVLVVVGGGHRGTRRVYRIVVPTAGLVAVDCHLSEGLVAVDCHLSEGLVATDCTHSAEKVAVDCHPDPKSTNPSINPRVRADERLTDSTTSKGAPALPGVGITPSAWTRLVGSLSKELGAPPALIERLGHDVANRAIEDVASPTGYLRKAIKAELEARQQAESQHEAEGMAIRRELAASPNLASAMRRFERWYGERDDDGIVVTDDGVGIYRPDGDLATYARRVLDMFGREAPDEVRDTDDETFVQFRVGGVNADIGYLGNDEFEVHLVGLSKADRGRAIASLVWLDKPVFRLLDDISSTATGA